LSDCTQPIVWVADSRQLQALCEHWLTLPWLAMDTEFMRTDTFYPVPALVQVNDGEANYLLDPRSIDDFAPLAKVMVAPSVQKVLHACSEDLEVFQILLKCLPVNLLDTQVAAAFCGYGYSVGYANLVNAVLQIQLPKDETRSNWLQRPLTEAQQRYAALDVEYLHRLTVILKAQLQELQRESWVADECDLLINNFLESQKLSNASQRFRGAWRLNQWQLAALMELAAWRDQTAQSRDVVRSHVVRDKSLFAIAELLPSDISQLRKIPELGDKSLRRYGEHIIEIVTAVRAMPEDTLPARLPRPPSSAQQARINSMRDALAELSVELKVAPEYLARRRDFEFMMRALQEGRSGDQLFPPGFNGWRAELVKPRLQKFL
jgi:ribonuclease D